MEAGMALPDGTRLSGASVVQIAGKAHYEIGIKEGKNRQIRRMCESLGYDVQRLHRVSIGEILLGSLKEGEFRALSAHERISILSHH
jgi:pseudouridine synthase